MEGMTSYKALHDEMLAQMPEDAKHDFDNCPLCVEEANDNDAQGGSMKTFTEEEVQSQIASAVAEATQKLSDELASLKEAGKKDEVAAAITEAKAELEGQITDLQAKLDTAVLEAESAKTEKDEILAWLQEEGEKAARETELATLRDERVAKVAEVASFPEDYIKTNTDRWASMDQEHFDALLEDYKAVASRDDNKIPAKTKLVASRESKTSTNGSAMKEVIRLREKGLDPRQLI